MNLEMVQELVDGALRQLDEGIVKQPAVVSLMCRTGAALVVYVGDGKPSRLASSGCVSWDWPVAATFLGADGEVKVLRLEACPTPTTAPASA